MIYFDNGATTLPKPWKVVKQMAWALSACGNPGRGGHRQAMAAAEAIYACRCMAAKMFGAKPEQVTFTSSATHGINIALHTLIAPGDRVVTSGFEHNAVTRTLTALEAKIVPASTAMFDAEQTYREFCQALEEKTKAVVVNHVSNVFGSVQPLPEIADLCRRKGIPLVVDAAQSAGVLPLDLQRLGEAFIAMPGHKGLYGPQGTGILLSCVQPKPLLYGGTGSQSALPLMPDFLPDRLEAGTLNVPGILGLQAGLEFVQQATPEHIRSHEQRLAKRMAQGLGQIPGVRVFGDGQTQQVGVLSFVVKDRDGEEVAQALAEREIAVRAGLHCAPLAHRSAGTDQTGTVRVSFSAFNTLEEVERFLRCLRDICRGTGEM